ncbi:glycoside hydrolase family 2 TIM barrel-domain containing protein [Parafrigoribacterium mesophilum]|uniref:glycoside hydrolase family 2 protein n=1 Tax=Parafrigoribacterium mesophilum TaxID=433646 RepID=UPI0031FE1E9B
MTLPRRDETDEFSAFTDGGSYPRPQLVRAGWADLRGVWDFEFDDNDEGLAHQWQERHTFERRITVPFPPESPASGIHETGFHPVVWYRREVSVSDLATSGFENGSGQRLILQFGAVDYRCQVWFNSVAVAQHEGGHTPFSVDLTDSLRSDAEPNILVVRAEDDPHDLSQPRGKQDWRHDPHAVWYHRTTGIWQPVWLEAVPQLSIEDLRWTPDTTAGTVRLDVSFSGRPAAGTTLRIELATDDKRQTTITLNARQVRTSTTLQVWDESNGDVEEALLWSPERPRLIGVTVTVSEATATAPVTDSVFSYFGMRSVGFEAGRFLLNDRPYYLRAVLSQGYWPQSHLTSPSDDALRAEVQVIKDLGFNAARVHQKIEDPRFLFWADTLGLLVWEEAPSAYAFTAEAVSRTVAEWTEAIERDASHPSVVTWVPLNESWGVRHIAKDPAMQDYARALLYLTKSLDPTRPVVSNDGWEHVDSDIWTVHDYEPSAEVVAARYRDAPARERLLAGIGPAGRRLRLSTEPDRGQPIMLTEFGGIRFTPEPESGAPGTARSSPRTWGYSSASSAEDYLERLSGLVAAVQSSSFLAGFCYTQLTDTLQEANGLLTEDRSPKLPIEQLRAIIRGDRPQDA